MRIIVADPTIPTNRQTIQRLFPEYSESVVGEKVIRTGERFSQALKDAGGKPSRLEVYYFPHALNYSAQCIDGKELVLSIFEMFRDKKIDAPAMVIDLRKSEHVGKFWQKELEGFLEKSRRV